MNNKIIILISHFNNIDGLLKSITSIQEQIEVDLLVIDDGSKIKPVLDMLKVFFKNSGNVQLLLNESNCGLVRSLNTALQYIRDLKKYQFIARLDCGDKFYADKLKIQLDFYKMYPHFYLVGTWVKYVDLQGRHLFCYCPPTDDEKIKRKLHSGNQFKHSSVMFRVECIDIVGLYPETYKHCEDYAYFFAIAKKLPVANINKILIEYELNPNGILIQNRNQQLKSVIEIILDNFDYSFRSALGLLYYSVCRFVPYKFILYLKGKLLKDKLN